MMTAAKTHLHHATMQAMTDTLRAAFGRVQRSFIVGAAHIRRLQPEQMGLTDGNLIPIGNYYKPELLAWFKK